MPRASRTSARPFAPGSIRSISTSSHRASSMTTSCEEPRRDRPAARRATPARRRAARRVRRRTRRDRQARSRAAEPARRAQARDRRAPRGAPPAHHLESRSARAVRSAPHRGPRHRAARGDGSFARAHRARARDHRLRPQGPQHQQQHAGLQEPASLLMSDLMSLLSMGSAGIAAQNSGIAVATNNVANANTEGYSRQEVMLESVLGPPLAGGVKTGDTSRYASELLSQRIRTASGSLAGSTARQSAISDLENTLTSGTTVDTRL